MVIAVLFLQVLGEQTADRLLQSAFVQKIIESVDDGLYDLLQVSWEFLRNEVIA